MPVRYAVWVELLLIELLIPNSSLMGHLSGILVGLLHNTGAMEPFFEMTDKVFAHVESAFAPADPRRAHMVDGREFFFSSFIFLFFIFSLFLFFPPSLSVPFSYFH